MKTTPRKRVFARLLFGLIAFIMLTSVWAPADAQAPMNPQEVAQATHRMVEKFKDVYVFPEVAQRTATTILERLHAGRYGAINTKQEFADVMGRELRELSGDGHQSLMVREPGGEVTHILTPIHDKRKNNFGIEQVKVLPDNVGYLKFNKFSPHDGASQVFDHAMGFLQHTDALVIDLSECIGGSPDLVSHLLSHFFKQETPLWQIVNRAGEVTYTAKTDPDVGVAKMKQNYPIAIVTTEETASAAEAFTYSLKHAGKAITVGTPTLGIANPVGAFAIDEDFFGRFSAYQAVSVLTDDNWEQAPIEPDVETMVSDGVTIAHQLIVEQIKRQRQ